MSSNETQNTSGSQKPKWLTATLILALVVIVGSGVVLLRSKKSSTTSEQGSQVAGSNSSSSNNSNSSSAQNSGAATSTVSQTQAGNQAADSPSSDNNSSNSPADSGNGNSAGNTAGAGAVAVAVPPSGATPAAGSATGAVTAASALNKAGMPDSKQLQGKTVGAGAAVGAGVGAVIGAGAAVGAGATAIAPAGGLPVKAPGIPSVAMAPNAIQKTEQAPPAPTEGCLTLSYHHKKTAGHSSEESCLNHKNLIKLKHTNANSICVRVNKTPVAFEKVAGKSDEILVAPGAGPHAEITVRYCFGKKSCPEDCTIPKDDFMGSIGASAHNEKDEGAAQWDPSEKADPSKPKLNVHAKIDSDLKKDLETLDESDSAPLSTFKDWIADAENPACGTKQAMR